MGNLLNVKQAAQALGCSKHFLYRKVETGQVPVYRLGRAVRFDPEELRAWAQQQAKIQKQGNGTHDEG